MSGNKRRGLCLRLLALLPVFIAVICACERRELEVYSSDKVAIRIDVDWMTDYGYTPEGMTLMLCKDGDEVTYSTITNDVHSHSVMLEPGTYYLTVFNNTTSEFYSMHFEDLNSHYAAAVRSYFKSSRYSRAWDGNIQYLMPPEDIGVATDTFTITPEMIEEQQKFLNWHWHDNLSENLTEYVFPVVVEPLITRLHVRCNVKGATSISAIEASITGFADGCYLNRVIRTNEFGNLQLDGPWTFTPADETRTWGTIENSIATFGLPFGKEIKENRDSADNIFHINFLLRNDSLMDRSFKVGKTLVYRTPSGDALTLAELLRHIEVEVYIPDTIYLPPVEGNSASAFDAEVMDWQPGDTFVIGGF